MTAEEVILQIAEVLRSTDCDNMKVERIRAMILEYKDFDRYMTGIEGK